MLSRVLLLVAIVGVVRPKILADLVDRANRLQARVRAPAPAR
jgi:hypothetical protein